MSTITKTTLLSSLCFLFGWVQFLGAQVSVDHSSSSTSKSSYTVGSGSDRMIIVSVQDECGCASTVSSVTWGSSSLSYAQGAHSNGVITEIWYLNEAGISSAGSATNDFIVTWSSAPNSESFHAITASNINQSAALSSAVGTGTSTNTIQVASPITVAADGMVFYTTASRKNGDTHTPSTGYTEVAEQNITLFTTASAYKLTTVAGTEQPRATYGDPLTLNIVAVYFPTNSTLPIELIEFNPRFNENGNSVDLFWSTSSEINNNFFTVERSQDHQNWETLHKVEGAGTTEGLRHYNTVDSFPLPGISYYRLKQTDFDGKFTYSNTKSIELTSITSCGIEVYPNPATSIVQVSSKGNLNSNIQLFDATGRPVKIQKSAELSSPHHMILDLTNLPAGLYFLNTELGRVPVVKK